MTIKTDGHVSNILILCVVAPPRDSPRHVDKGQRAIGRRDLNVISWVQVYWLSPIKAYARRRAATFRNPNFNTKPPKQNNI